MNFEDKINAIKEKVGQLKKVNNGILSKDELKEIITKRRVDWIKENLSEMLIKYGNLTPEEQAYKIIFLEHMKINPMHSEIERISKNKIKIKSYNFCPYLEACEILGLETKLICKEIGEPAIQEMIKFINPHLKFSRNYNHIRPYEKFCEEYIEFIE